MTSAQADHVPAFEVVMASAGTGKTFALTNRLAGLLARGVAPERILAATFTRQAAGEIRERLLSRIARSAASDAEAATLSGHAGVSLDAAGWLGVLKRLCRSIHRVRMGTLDSTAQGLAKSLAPQLGLVTPWRQAFEHVEEQLRAEVVERLLEELATPEDRAPIRMLTGREGSTTGDQRLAELLADSGAQLRRTQPDAWACLAEPASSGPTLDEVRQAARRVGDLPLPHNKGGTPNKNWMKARDKLVSAIERGDFAAAIQTKLVTCCQEETPAYHGVDAPTEWLPELQTILEGVVRHEVSVLHERNLVAGALLSRAVEIEDAVRREHRAYSLGDLWRALAESDLETQQVAYRMDARFDHVLLDEFQDTSIDQWRVLEPLIDEAVAGGERERSVFVVGDVKQSLYGWRNAQAGLLPYVAQRWPQMHTRPLNKTWRCRGTVVDAVNRVFGGLCDNPNMEAHAAAAERFADQFKAHESAVEGEGFVRAVDLTAVLDDPDDEDGAIAAVADAVARTHDACPDAQVAVLVRRRHAIGRLVAALADRGVPAVSNTSASPCDHPVVESVLSALHLAAHPGDGPSRYSVATGPLGAAIGLTAWNDAGRARRLSGDLTLRVFEEGLARAVEWLATRAGEATNARGRARLADLVRLAEQYEAEAPEAGGIDDFIASVRASRIQPRRGGLVRVLTLHAAKGLQFDAVFLMDLDGPLASHPPSFLSDAGGAEAADPTAAPTRMSLPGTKELREYCPELAGMYEQWRVRAVYDELCLLYVGMTRAKAHLELFIRSDAKGLGSVAWRGFGGEGNEVREGGLGWIQSVQAAQAPAATPSPAWSGPESVPEHWNYAEQPWRIATIRPSEFGEAAGVSSLLATDAAAADLGAEIHHLLEGVEWLEDAPADPLDWIDQVGPLTREAARRIKGALEGGTLVEALSRSAQTDTWPGLELSVERERPISVVVEADGRPALVRGRIDRLVIGRQSGQVARCQIFDFKTGEAGERGAAQLDLYRAAVARLYGVALKDVGASLVLIGNTP